MTAAAATPRGADGAELTIDVRGASRRSAAENGVERGQHADPFGFAEPADPIGIVIDRFPHHLALRFVRARRRLPQAGDRPVVEREGHFDHTHTIPPYRN